MLNAHTHTQLTDTPPPPSLPTNTFCVALISISLNIIVQDIRLNIMTVCTSVGKRKRMHTLPSRPALGEPQGFSEGTQQHKTNMCASCLPRGTGERDRDPRRSGMGNYT